MNYVSLRTFKSAAKQKATTAGAQLHKALVASVSPMGERTVKFTISTGAVDRDNDTVDQAGWDITEFERNPVVLWSHDASSLPIGKCIAIGVEDGALKAAVEFVPSDMPIVGPLAEAVLRMCRDGFLSATSVGFLPTAYEVSSDRTKEESWYPAVDFKEQKLLEFSVCSIPANPEALIEPGQFVDDPVEEVAETDADKAAAEAVAKALAASAARRARLARAHRLTEAYEF